MPAITPFLWFDHEAEEAAKFYTSIFKKSKIKGVTRYGAGEPGTEGSVMTVNFQLNGQDFTALNGGPVPHFKFNESISFVVHCKTQKEVDHYWEKLLKGGEESQCGWLKDKYGVSWQVVPDALLEMIKDKNKERKGRVMAAMMKMVKLDLGVLKKAHAGK